MASRKGKRRNSEKRKEKSRDAARCRRNKEADVFSDLASLLPLSPSQTLQQDKASIMRLAISHLKLRKLLGKDARNGDIRDYENSLQKKLDVQYSKAMEGFVIVIAKAGDMVYLSENVSKYLGLTQLDLVGHSVFDFTHPCDHDEIQEMLTEKSSSSPSTSREERSFLMRMKCTLTNKGRNINLKSATYKVMSCSGRYVTPGSGSYHHFPGLLDNGLDKNMTSLLLIAEPIQHPANIEVPLDSRTFISRHSLDMRVTYCDDRIVHLLGYQNDNIINQSIYDFHHALDTEVIREACKNLYSKGQAVISRYRFLARGGGYCWVQTEATMICHQRTDKPQCIVCVNYVLSGVEESHLILSNVQTTDLSSMLSVATPPPQVTSPAPSTTPTSCSMPPTLPSGITLSTESIFAQRPSDADNNMLCITNVDGKIDILQDLAELAPSAGEIIPFMNDDEELYKDVDMMPGCYNKGLEQVSPAPNNTPTSAAPFGGNTGMTILDLSFLRNDCPAASGTQNEALFSDNTDFMKMTKTNEDPSTQIKDDMDDVDFDLRAPYIPMDGEDDKILDPNWIPLLDEQMENSKMLGMTETVFAQKPPEPVDDSDDKYKVPLSILRLQAANKILDASVGDISRNAGPPKIKRPMETNRLENGPPVAKATRVEPLKTSGYHPSSSTTLAGKEGSRSPAVMETDVPELCFKSTSASKDHVVTSGSSVLMNLLTQGQDVNYGYKITQAKPLIQLASLQKNGNSSLKALLLGEETTSDSEEFDDSETTDGSVVMISSDTATSPVETPPPPPALQGLPKPPMTSIQRVQHFCQKSPLSHGNPMMVTVIPARNPTTVTLSPPKAYMMGTE